MQIVPVVDNLHKMSKLSSCEKKRNNKKIYFKLSSAGISTGLLSVNLLICPAFANSVDPDRLASETEETS